MIDPSDLLIVKATADDCLELTELAKVSKAYWGYDQALMRRWDKELTILPSYLERAFVAKLCYKGKIIAYYSLLFPIEGQALLDNLFVLPTYMGNGLGRVLLEHAIAYCLEKGISKMVLQADPHAEGFYRKHGFRIVGKKKSSVPGRYLPIMEKVF